MAAVDRKRKELLKIVPIPQLEAASMVAEGPRSWAGSVYTCTHAVTTMQLQITPCSAQVAGHTSDKTDQAQLRETSATILAANA